VLLVDDDEMVLSVLEQMLLRLGCHCETAMSGHHALELLDSNYFDVMITDIAMPGMRGFELTERAKMLRPDMRIMVVSGFVGDALRKKALEAGASDFIEKPISLSHLEKKLQSLSCAAKIGG
jgi:CheY-like chemotaxis protein